MLIVRRYKDLSQLFLGINREIATNAPELLTHSTLQVGYCKPLYLEAEEPRFGINMAELQYTARKFSKLKQTYVDQEELKFFKAKIREQKGLSCTFYFKNRKARQGSNSDNGPCLIAIVVTRPKKNGIWDTAHIYYRSTQINRIFGIDLLLISKFVEELPDCCDVHKCCFHIPQPWQAAMYLPAQQGLFKFKVEDMAEGTYKQQFEDNIERMYSGQKSSYKAARRMQEIYYGERHYQMVDQNIFKLEDE